MHDLPLSFWIPASLMIGYIVGIEVGWFLGKRQ